MPPDIDSPSTRATSSNLIIESIAQRIYSSHRDAIIARVEELVLGSLVEHSAPPPSDRTPVKRRMRDLGGFNSSTCVEGARHIARLAETIYLPRSEPLENERYEWFARLVAIGADVGDAVLSIGSNTINPRITGHGFRSRPGVEKRIEDLQFEKLLIDEEIQNPRKVAA